MDGRVGAGHHRLVQAAPLPRPHRHRRAHHWVLQHGSSQGIYTLLVFHALLVLLLVLAIIEGILIHTPVVTLAAPFYYYVTSVYHVY